MAESAKQGRAFLVPGAVTRVPHSSTWHCHRAGQGQGSTARALPAPGICPDPPAAHPAPGQWRSEGRSTGSRGAPGTDSIGLREQEMGWGGKKASRRLTTVSPPALKSCKGTLQPGNIWNSPPVPGAAAHRHILAEAFPGCLHPGHCLAGSSCPLHARCTYSWGQATPAARGLQQQGLQSSEPVLPESLRPCIPGASILHISTAASLIACVPGASPHSLGGCIPACSHPWDRHPQAAATPGA